MSRLTRQQERTIHELIIKHEPVIRSAFLEAVKNARAAVDFDALVEAVRVGDLVRADELLGITRAALYPVTEATRTATVSAGLAVTTPKALAGTFGFDGSHPRAEQFLARVGADLVTEIGSPGVEAVRAVVLQAQSEGVGVQATVRRLSGTINPRNGIREGGIMGLDGPRAERSARVREILNDPDQIVKYFKGDKPRYTSTDRRFDARVRRAIAEGRALDKTTIDKITKAHDARLLKARGATIAKDQAFTAQAQGRDEAYRQLAESDKVESVKKRWGHNTAKDARHDHAELDGLEIDLDEEFPMGNGDTLKYAHDPAADAKHKLGCRCNTVYIVKYRRP